MGFNLLGFLSDLGSAISAPFDAVSGLFNSITGLSDSWKTMTGRGDTSSVSQSKDLMDYQMQNQKNLMQFGNDLQVAQWNRENAYNHPSAQLERLKQAGLNPLFHGLDGNAAGGLSAVSFPSAPDLGSILNAVGATMQMRFQQMQTRAQVKLLDAQADKTEAEAKAQNVENEYQRDRLEDEKVSRHFQATYDAHKHQWLFNTPTDPNKNSFSIEDSYVWKEFESKFAELRSSVAKASHDEKFYTDKKQFIMREFREQLRKLTAEADEKEQLYKNAQVLYDNIIKTKINIFESF